MTSFMFQDKTNFQYQCMISFPPLKRWYFTDQDSGFMMTSSNGNIFRVTGPLCGEFTGPGEFPTQMPVARSFDVFFDLCLNKRLSKQPWGWWFDTLSWSLWRECNVVMLQMMKAASILMYCKRSDQLFACKNTAVKHNCLYKYKGIHIPNNSSVFV